MLYRQEGELVPFTAWPWMRVITQLDTQYFQLDYEYLYAYFKKDYLWVYWDLEAMKALSSLIYQQYKNNINRIYLPFTKKAQELEEFYLNTYEEDFDSYSKKKLLKFIGTLWQKHTAMWSRSLFIDSFDPGTDQQEITQIAVKYNLTMEEVAILTTPEQLTFASERMLEFYSLILKLKIKFNTPEELAKSPAMQEHRKRYDYYQYSYAHIHRLTENQVFAECRDVWHDSIKLKEEYEKLRMYTLDQRKKVQVILRKHQLRKNPLHFFQQLTYWREHRKKVNLMGVHLWHRILEALENKIGIPKRHLEYLNHDEINLLMKGTLKKEVLRQRYEEGVMIHVTRKGYSLFVGGEAIAKKKECEKRIIFDTSEELKGHIACKGIAQGRVKIIITREDFSKFKEGDILVAGMTRPEHVPLMKKAAAIVTNEGGITCHAAIVSRELKKPCIIGTKVATEALKDGEMVEVDAVKGFIRKLR